MHRIRVGMNLSRVADAATAILHRVGIYALAIATRLWHPYAIVLARHWGEVADDDRDFVRIPATPQIGYDAFGRIRYVDPVEPLGLAIETIPAPALSAARAASRAAPVACAMPERTSAAPRAYLCERGPRRGSACRQTAGEFTKVFGAMRASALA